MMIQTEIRRKQVDETNALTLRVIFTIAVDDMLVFLFCFVFFRENKA